MSLSDKILEPRGHTPMDSINSVETVDSVDSVVSDESDSDSDTDPTVPSLDLVGVHWPSIDEFRRAHRDMVSVLGTHMGMLNYKERLQGWYTGEKNLPFFMDLHQRLEQKYEQNRGKLNELVREGPRVFFLKNLPSLPRPEGFFSLSELSVPEISFPEISFPELSLPELPTFPRLSDYLGEMTLDQQPELVDLGLELTVADLEQSFSPVGGGFGCEHYMRNCKVHCITCERFYPCRLCHDEIEDHALPRRETKYMLCYMCGHAQAAAQDCAKCHSQMASYYCSECKLWSDDDTKPIFHCADCEICRVGHGLLIDTFHCHKCGICMDLTEADKHKCIERSTHSNCPICLGYMFNSTETLVLMVCGHPMHKTCYDVYTEQSYRCPLCSKSIVDTSALFRVIDDEVAQEVLPPDLAARRVDIKCCDCRGKSRVPFQIAGLKCSICRSYNTVKV